MVSHVPSSVSAYSHSKLLSKHLLHVYMYLYLGTELRPLDRLYIEQASIDYQTSGFQHRRGIRADIRCGLPLICTRIPQEVDQLGFAHGLESSRSLNPREAQSIVVPWYLFFQLLHARRTAARAFPRQIRNNMGSLRRAWRAAPGPGQAGKATLSANKETLSRPPAAPGSP